ncbi:hypothetical protein C3F09_06995 [candidate division GN15 bacterium]|uniref:C_GCAxxG_C_C family protein n=1 Tax=candidate division GN15 bacterium TaxID=2072418 RepID=A0A855X5Q2_9BACT|nr:MAG: hypothetical protein C3F09_06995 [candidate division GN15 bacterium]
MNKSKIEDAVDCFAGGFNCSQAVFSTYAAHMGLDRETALKISGAFGGGMARMGDTCGAVTGALMVIGFKYGKSKAEDDAAKEKSYEVAREFVSQFKERHGSIVCRELAGCDLNTSEGRQEFEEKQVGKTVCPHLVGEAVEILERIL